MCHVYPAVSLDYSLYSWPEVTVGSPGLVTTPASWLFRGSRCLLLVAAERRAFSQLTDSQRRLLGAYTIGVIMERTRNEFEHVKREALYCCPKHSIVLVVLIGIPQVVTI